MIRHLRRVRSGSSTSPAWAPLALVALALLSGCNVRRDPGIFADVNGEPPDGPVVQLRAGDIPVIGTVAVHCWFAVYDPAVGAWHRWDVWERAAHGPDSWGHLRRDIKSIDSWMRPSFIHCEWRGDEARRLIAVLDQPERYPYRDLYRYWPGPNSNTFPAWVCRQAGVACDLPVRAIGKDYRALLIGGGVTPSRTGLQLETPLVGGAVGLTDGVELHLLGSTWGVDTWPPALQTPFFRLGWPE